MWRQGACCEPRSNGDTSSDGAPPPLWMGDFMIWIEDKELQVRRHSLFFFGFFCCLPVLSDGKQSLFSIIMLCSLWLEFITYCFIFCLTVKDVTFYHTCFDFLHSLIVLFLKPTPIFWKHYHRVLLLLSMTGNLLFLLSSVGTGVLSKDNPYFFVWLLPVLEMVGWRISVFWQSEEAVKHLQTTEEFEVVDKVMPSTHLESLSLHEKKMPCAFPTQVLWEWGTSFIF